MPESNNNSWNEWSKHVLAELVRAHRRVDGVEGAIEAMRVEVLAEIREQGRRWSDWKDAHEKAQKTIEKRIDGHGFQMGILKWVLGGVSTIVIALTIGALKTVLGI